MKITFRIYEKLNKYGETKFFVKQKWLGLFWMVPSTEFRSIVDGYCRLSPTEFNTIGQVRNAIEEVRDIMEKQKKVLCKSS
jgi:hypothetical protein